MKDKKSWFWWGEPSKEEKRVVRRKGKKYFFIGFVGLVIALTFYFVPSVYSRYFVLFGAGVAFAFLPIGIFELLTGVDSKCNY